VPVLMSVGPAVVVPHRWFPCRNDLTKYVMAQAAETLNRDRRAPVPSDEGRVVLCDKAVEGVVGFCIHRRKLSR
jgi:hypothetical protein